MGKVIIHAPWVEPITIDGIMSCKHYNKYIKFFSEHDAMGICKGTAPLTSVVEWLE